MFRYMGELKLGGYTKPWRREVLQAGLLGYGRMWASEVREDRPLNRPEVSTRAKRRANRLVGNRNWFKPKPKTQGETCRKSGNLRPKKHNQPEKIPESVLFVLHTPGGALEKALQKIEDAGVGSKISAVVRFVERGGDTIHQLGNPAPWTKLHCGRETCPPPVVQISQDTARS